MKKKILSFVLAALSAATLTVSSFAAVEDITMRFDSEVSLDYVNSFGNVSAMGLTYDITTDNYENGAGSLVVSESFSSASASSVGVYFKASDFGLSSFAGYNITVSVMCTSAAANNSTYFELFADGDVYTSETYETSESVRSWTSYTLYVPTSSTNDKVGINIPMSDSFDGVVCYIDNFVITDAYGNAIANIGDEAVVVHSEGTSTVVTVLTILLLVILIAAAIGGVALFVVKSMKKYR